MIGKPNFTSAGSKLINCGQGLYCFFDGREVFVDLPTKIAAVMIMKGVKPQSVEDAFVNIMIHGFKVAHFGIKGSFLF